MSKLNLLIVEENIPKDTELFKKNISYIEDEEKKLKFDDRCCEIKNWLNYIK